MLTLDEVIKGEYGIVDACESMANTCDLDDPYAKKVAYENGECAERHKQIAEWLKELKQLKEKESCEDAISRVETVKFLADHSNDFEDVKLKTAFKVASSLVNNFRYLPTVRPTQRKGKWLNKGINGHNFYGKCSNCGQEFCVDTWYTQNMKYCPNCGTKMEEK